MSSAEAPQLQPMDGNHGRQRPNESYALTTDPARNGIADPNHPDYQVDADIDAMFHNVPGQLHQGSTPAGIHPEVVFEGSSPQLLGSQFVTFSKFAQRAQQRKHSNPEEVEMWQQRAHEALMALAKAEGRSPVEVRDELKATEDEFVAGARSQFGFNNEIFRSVSTPVAEEITTPTSDAAQPAHSLRSPLASESIIPVAPIKESLTIRSLRALYDLHAKDARQNVIHGDHDQAKINQTQAERVLHALAKETGVSDQALKVALASLNNSINHPVLAEEEFGANLSTLPDDVIEARLHRLGSELHRKSFVDRGEEFDAARASYKAVFEEYADRRGWSERQRDRQWKALDRSWEGAWAVQEEVKESRARVFASRLRDRVRQASHIIANPIDSIKAVNSRVDAWAEERGHPQLGRVARVAGALAVAGATGAVLYTVYKAHKHGAHAPVAAGGGPKTDPALRKALTIQGNGSVTEAAKTLPGTSINGIGANGPITINVAPGQGFESVFHNLGLSHHDAARAYHALKPLLKNNGGTYRMGNEYGIARPGNFTLNSQASDTLRAFLKANGLI